MAAQWDERTPTPPNRTCAWSIFSLDLLRGLELSYPLFWQELPESFFDRVRTEHQEHALPMAPRTPLEGTSTPVTYDDVSDKSFIDLFINYASPSQCRY